MEPLFIRETHKFEKVGQQATLPTNESEWPAVILGELYRQAPYIEGSYVPEVVFSEKNPEKGEAIGSVIITSPTTLPQSEAAGPRGKEVGIRRVQLPFIIRGFKLAPLDLLVLDNGEFKPQNRQRLRDSLFKASYTDGTSRGTRWNTWLDSLAKYPMGSMGYMSDGGMGSSISYDKLSSAPVMSVLSPLSKEAYASLEEELNHPFCQQQLVVNPFFRSALKKIAHYKTVGRGREVALAESIPPTVIQVIRQPGATYLVKRANPDVFEPVEEELDRSEALQQLGKDTVRSVDESGMVTTSTSPVVRQDLTEEKIGPVKDFGLYTVRVKSDGRRVVGWVFPRVVDIDGTSLPMAVFTNGSENALQPVIAGTRAGSAPGLPSCKPYKVGTFYRTTGDDAVCLIPLEVRSASYNQAEGGVDSAVYDVTTIMGRDTRLHATPGISKILPHPDRRGEYLIPADMKFLPLPAERTVTLMEDATEVEKIASLRRNTLTIRYMGDDRYTLEGCGIDKLAESQRSHVTPEQALFLSVVVGMHPEFALTKLAKVRKSWVTSVPHLKVIRPAAEVMVVEMSKLARAGFTKHLRALPKPVWLVKEAAFLGDEDSTDKILSLGFINPHNISVFLSYIPEFEQTQGKICKILFMSRIGNNPDLESAAERTMHGMENVLASLRLIGLEQQSESDVVS